MHSTILNIIFNFTEFAISQKIAENPLWTLRVMLLTILSYIAVEHFYFSGCINCAGNFELHYSILYTVGFSGRGGFSSRGGSSGRGGFTPRGGRGRGGRGSGRGKCDWNNAGVKFHSAVYVDQHW